MVCSYYSQTVMADARYIMMPLADPGGRQGRAPLPPGSKFFHFHAVFGKKLKNNSTFGSWRTPPPPGKSLDPPLDAVLPPCGIFSSDWSAFLQPIECACPISGTQLLKCRNQLNVEHFLNFKSNITFLLKYMCTHKF